MEVEEELIHTCLLKLYWACIAVVWFYSLGKWKNLLTAVWIYSTKSSSPDEVTSSCNATKEESQEESDCIDNNHTLSVQQSQPPYEPAVTVQIMSYNEGEVVPTTMAKACELDWPKHKLFIQVLDDSTDPDCAKVVQQAVAYQSQRGANIQYKTRSNRHGYKAGNLLAHHDSIQSDFVLYLDADHQVQPNLLRKTVKYFQNQPKLALVQTPWGYYNTHENFLTECDALGLDIHHTVEQPARSKLYGCFGFNGTGGVWRKQAIDDAGGWTSDTVTEDLSISYLAVLQGYKFQYVTDCPQRLELPAGILAHIQQKKRWTKGFFQVFRHYYWRILCSKSISIWLKMEAFMHFTGPVQLVAATIGILVYPHLVFHAIHTPLIEGIAAVPVLEPILSTLHAIFTKTPSTNSDFNVFYTRCSRIIMMLPYLSLRFGMAPFELKAVFEGFFSDDATFHTTPKEGSSSPTSRRTKTVAISPMKVKSLNWSDDMVAYGALSIGFHQFLYVAMYDIYADTDTTFDLCARSLNILICVGLVIVSGSFLYSKHEHLREKLMCRAFSTPVALHRKLSRARVLYFGYFICCLLSGVSMCFMHVVSTRVKIGSG